MWFPRYMGFLTLQETQTNRGLINNSVLHFDVLRFFPLLNMQPLSCHSSVHLPELFDVVLLEGVGFPNSGVERKARCEILETRPRPHSCLDEPCRSNDDTKIAHRGYFSAFWKVQRL